ncbi:MAG: YraN family protein [Armatimonadota bacterium]
MRQNRLGRWGEECAMRHLQAQGYQVVARNWRTREGEIDLIVQKGLLLVFVEVKTRRSVRFGAGEESVDTRKQARLAQLAQHYLDAHPQLTFTACRFDVVVVDLTHSPPQIRHYENAFYPH